MSVESKKKSLMDIFVRGKGFSWGLLIGVTALFTLILYPNIAVKKHIYQVGEVAKRDVKAPADFFVIDQESTDKRKKEAVASVLTVYDHDTTLATRTVESIRTAFSEMREVIAANKTRRNILKNNPGQDKDSIKEEKQSLHDTLWELKETFENSMGIKISNGAYKILEKEGFSETIENILVEIVQEILSNGVVANKEVLLQEQDKGITLRSLETKTEQVEHNLKTFYGPDQAKTMVRVLGKPLLKNAGYTVRGLIVDLAQQFINPNITLNRSETQERKKKAAKGIKDVLYRIRAGEMLLREGEVVNELQLRKLEAMQAQVPDEEIFTSRIGTFMLVLCIFLVVYALHFRGHRVVERDPNKNLLFIASVLVIFLLLTKISVSLADSISLSSPMGINAESMYYFIPLASGAMTVCLFMGMEIALPFSVVLSSCTAIVFNNRFDLFIYFLLSSAISAFWLQHCRERIVFIKAGVKLGLLNLVFVTAVDVYMSEYSDFKLLWDWIFAFMGGVVAGILTAGIAPLVESAFGYTTDIKLLELVNLDRPILRRLMIEASGTYHHSVIVGSMVEAAASAIGANPLLARVCGYYHDIGKINKPLYFIENQTNGKNRHDKLAPSMSSLILISHLKDGVEIAKENKLGKAIIDTIQQHHGTSLIRPFYEKAKQLKGEENVKIDDYRYPGPKPQTREAGLVMLADVIEAASRTLENPTHPRIQGLVQNLINKIFSDGQLDNCELTLRDLHNIAKSYIKILDGIYHHRIEYPESAAPGGPGKAKNGNSDRQQTEQSESKAEEDPTKSSSHLKRLGQS